MIIKEYILEKTKIKIFDDNIRKYKNEVTKEYIDNLIYHLLLKSNDNT